MVRIDGTHFKDERGRTLMLRGVNLGGSSKVPRRPDGATHRLEGFYDHRDVSFVGRPFTLDVAAEHLDRLKRWGLDTLRFLITWEAIEHAGPGIYDEAYLDHVAALVEEAGRRGFTVLIDPHQDVWSRFCGGDGAPGWTLEAVGFDLRRLHRTGAAFLHQVAGDPLLPMIWVTNGAKLAAATMFTLFFGGDDFAPLATIEGEPAQGFLQRHYIGAVSQVARRLRGMPQVMGYETINEPLAGYIGLADLAAPAPLVEVGPLPSPIEGMALGEGLAQEVETWKPTFFGPRKTSPTRLDPRGARAWQDEVRCLWRENGVWAIDGQGRPRLLRADHFSHVRGRRVDFPNDYYKPFANRFAAGIRLAHPEAAIFLNDAWNHGPPRWTEGDAPEVAYAPHWYDGYVLFQKSYSPWAAVNNRSRKIIFGPGPIRRCFADQLGELRAGAAERLGGVPALLGEVGVAFDLDGGRAFRTGDFKAQLAALDRSFRAVEDSLLSCTLWNYTPDNTNARGDGWNGEDLSIFSRDQQDDPSDPDSGGRALDAAVRPYPRATAGEPVRLRFDRRSRRFEYEFLHDPEVTAPTEIFVPRFQYPEGFVVEVSDGRVRADEGAQLVVYRHGEDRSRHRVVVRPR